MQLTVVNRQCGACTACCTTCGVPELNKPMNTPCAHQGSAGCVIYGNHPRSCREFTCAWLAGDLPEKYRPDQCGIVFWSADARVIRASLTRPDIPIERVKYLLEKLAAARPRTVNGRIVTFRDRAVLVIPPDVQIPADPQASARTIRYEVVEKNLFVARKI